MEERDLGNMKISTLGMALAAVLLLVAAVGVSLGSISLGWLGLAVLAGSFVLERMKM